MRRIARLALATFVVSLCLPALAATATAAIAPAGAELAIGSPPTDWQRAPAATYVGARAVVAWEDTAGLYARFYDAAGAAASAPIRLAANDPLPEVPFDVVATLHRQPAVLARGDGFLVVWVEQKMRIRSYFFHEQRTLQSNKLMARLFDGNGAPRTGAWELASARQELARPAVVGDAQAFWVVWQQSGGEAKGIYLRRSTDTARLGAPITVVAGNGRRAALAIARNRLLVAWDQWGGSGAGVLQVYARLFGTDGEPIGGAFGVSTGAAQSEQPAVVAGRDGEFLVAWQRSPDGRKVRIDGQLFSRAGATLGPVLTLSSGVGLHGTPRLAALADGGYLVSWMQWFGTFSNAVLAAEFDGLGNAQSEVVRVSVGRIVGPWSEALAVGPGGKVLAVWEGGDESRRPSLRGRLLLPASP